MSIVPSADLADSGRFVRQVNAALSTALKHTALPLVEVAAEAHVSVWKLIDSAAGVPVNWFVDEVVLLASALDVRVSVLLGGEDS